MKRCTRSFVRKGGSLFPGMQRLGILSLLLLFLAGSASAQVSTASINGVIRDPTGAVVPDATIVLTNVDTSVARTSTANNAGAYGFVSIPPGNYTIESTAKGFSSQKLAPFVLAVGQAATFDFALTVGTETQVVNVTSAAAQLDVTNANLGTVISTQQVNDLPLNGRNFTALLALTPGVVAISTAQNGTNIAGGGFGSAIALGSDYTFPAINGQSNRSDYFLADGLPNYAAINSTYAVAPIIDAIQEFKVVSHTDDAEYGSVLGGVVNVVTKSGTNELHGDAWDYLRNTAFDARNYFLPHKPVQAFLPPEPIRWGDRRSGRTSPSCTTAKTKPFSLGLIKGGAIPGRRITTSWCPPPRNWPVMRRTTGKTRFTILSVPSRPPRATAVLRFQTIRFPRIVSTNQWSPGQNLFTLRRAHSSILRATARSRRTRSTLLPRCKRSTNSVSASTRPWGPKILHGSAIASATRRSLSPAVFRRYLAA